MKFLNSRIASVAVGSAVIGLVVVAGGGAAAFAHGYGSTIGGEDIRNESVYSQDIRNGQVRSAELHPSVKAQFGLQGLEADGPYPSATQLTEGANSTDKWAAGGGFSSSWVQCPEGKTAIGGGFSRADEGSAAFAGLQVVTSQPVQVKGGDPKAYEPIAGDVDGSFVPNGWLVEGFNNGDTDLIVRPHVVCATV